MESSAGFRLVKHLADVDTARNEVVARSLDVGDDLTTTSSFRSILPAKATRA